MLKQSSANYPHPRNVPRASLIITLLCETACASDAPSGSGMTPTMIVTFQVVDRRSARGLPHRRGLAANAGAGRAANRDLLARHADLPLSGEAGGRAP